MDADKKTLFVTGLFFSSISFASSHSHNDLASLSMEHLESMSLSELLELNVITPSRTKQKLIDAPANIQVITQLQIAQRGYANLVEVLQDLPGFDFSTYEDGGGEYPTHSSNRGLGGGPGNPKLLILLDGVVQNHVAFNWSQLWGEENIIEDLDRIEIIQGPGSAAYGANAFSGVVHLITKKQVAEENTNLHVSLGEGKQRGFTLTHQSMYKDLHMNAAIKSYQYDGDSGLGRYDPAGYFSGQPWPNTQVESYDNQGQYQTNSVNPFAGQQMPAGFNTSKDIWAMRANVSYFSPEEENLLKGVSKISLGFYLWDKTEGLASYVPNYEYQSWRSDFVSHHTGKHIYLDVDYRFNDKWLSRTRAWYRENRQKPDTGFRYTYRFAELAKTYHSFNHQVGIEEQLEWQQSDDSSLVLGARLMESDKMNQIASLGRNQAGHDPMTSSSWRRATQDDFQLGLAESQDIDVVAESAVYAIYDSALSSRWNYSLGLRYDYSEDFGNTFNPRLGFIYKMPSDFFEKLNVKFLYGQAFREPSIFELTDEHRGNSQLKPEEVATYEVIAQGNWQNSDQQGVVEAFNFTSSVFLSDMTDVISLNTAAARDILGDSGSHYFNAERQKVIGFSLSSDVQFSKGVKSYINYHFNKGDGSLGDKGLSNVADHKVNMGLNYDANAFNLDLRLNYVGKRNVPSTNTYFTDCHAPGYTKLNLHLRGKKLNLAGFNIKPSLKIENLLDEDYFGVGRQDGSSDVNAYDAQTNINPSGFIPAYHPQPGRQIFIKLEADL
ncbi:hypothetical protein C2869_10180 [Saccharobesus litoralis]|uniref:TonB-dependent receptor n=1 Tax=Saccharobesus litoralis TaxID=2172099 RepID=A0A2S0VRP7_9ALTE|nr:TonB-dependent receptor [Saccharobesus litoralis]AWB66770.1 hypothetical protein C2869_10180 [Saccharobesus litoralis]